MDVRDDSYFMLEPEQEEEFLALVSRPEQGSHASTELRRALGIAAMPQTFAATRCPAGGRSLLDEPGARCRARLTDIVKLWLIFRRVRSSLKQRPIQFILDELRASGPPDGAAPPTPTLVDRALRFAAARKAVPIAPNCLADSLALLVWLGSERSGATLVFAVKLDPFAAHCWVQTETLLLNDRVDDTARFQPVRTIACSPATR